jgi:Na+/H+ antiporter NhaD/arsenite permease-like protein
LLIPSIVSIAVPLFIARFFSVFKGDFEASETSESSEKSGFLLIIGLLLIIMVPIFKVLTHLPPYMGMMLSLSLFALIAELKSKRNFTLTNLDDAENHIAKSPTLKALGKIEMPSILFFLGILMTVAAMESLGLIYNFGQTVNQVMPQNLFVSLLGVASAVIDNVPLVAASMGMFHEAQDAQVWHFIAYTAGTGGSLLIIGSAAGVVAMGMEKIDFGWYLKHVTFLAFCGYISGLVVFLIYTQIIK